MPVASEPSAVEALPVSSALEEIARKLFWWKPPSDALADRIRFAAQVMTYGNWDDVQKTKTALGENTFRETLMNPPAGVFDPRSWVYWHHYFGIETVPPLPKRIIP
jgi:hypothetical protein